MRIIPAIDILDGKCVRLTRGDYQTSKIYSEDPLQIAQQYADSGLEYLHIVDLDGAKSNSIVNSRILKMIASQTTLKINFGGGIKNDEDVRIAFECGAHTVTIGSVAADKPQEFLKWVEEYGTDKMILGADCKERMIATHGWQTASTQDVVEYIIAYAGMGVTQVICTDISKDGMLKGPAFDLYQEILSRCTIRLVASGGISSIADLQRLKTLGCNGAIIGKALYEGHITLDQLNALC